MNTNKLHQEEMFYTDFDFPITYYCKSLSLSLSSNLITSCSVDMVDRRYDFYQPQVQNLNIENETMEKMKWN